MEGQRTSEAREGLVIVISGPSGGGKTTLCRRVLAADGRLCRVVTCTTRKPRVGEREGADYYFLSVADFAARVAAGDFLEHAEVHGNRYGTLRSEVRDRLRGGRDVLMNIDVQGAASVRGVAATDPELAAALVTVFLTPPSSRELEERLRGRGTEDERTLAARLRAAQGEVDRWGEFDYLVVSGTMEADLERLRMVLEVERMRSRRSQRPWR